MNIQSNKPLVSIVIITYNSEKFILETLESIKKQTYENIELIISDDCSTDNTCKICELWLKESKERFKYTELIQSQENSGIVANTNRGINAARGEWIKGIAGDDLLLENCIDANVQFAQENPNARFITSKMQNISENGELIHNAKIYGESYRKLYFNLSAEKQLKAYARMPVFLNSPAFFFKKEISDVMANKDGEFRIYEDTCAIYRVNGMNQKVFFLDDYTVKYRIHENSISRSADVRINDLRNKELALIFDKYSKKHLNKLNLIDLSVYYENWLNYKYKGFFGYKGMSVLLKLSLFQWYLKYLDLITKDDVI